MATVHNKISAMLKELQTKDNEIVHVINELQTVQEYGQFSLRYMLLRRVQLIKQLTHLKRLQDQGVLFIPIDMVRYD